MAIVALCILMSGTTQASEFKSEDIFPELGAIHVAETEIGFVGLLRASSDTIYLIVKRGGTQAKEVDAEEYGRRFPAQEYPIHRCLSCDPNHIHYSIQTRNNRKEYPIEPIALRWGNLEIPLKLKPGSQISAAERVGDQVWVGTERCDSHYCYEAEGVVVQSLTGGEKIRTIGVNGKIRGIRSDPFDSSVWITADSGIFHVLQSGRIEAQLRFFYSFDSEGRQAVLLASSSPRENRHLAVIGRLLFSPERQSQLYEAAKSIPEEDARELEFYWVFMCCGPAGKNLPESLKALVPVIASELSGSELAPDSWKRSLLQQIASWLEDPGH